MLSKQIEEYLSLNDEERNMIHCLVHSYKPMSINDIHHAFPSVGLPQVKALIEQGLRSGLICKDAYYTKEYFVNSRMVVWIFPLLKQKMQEPQKDYTFYGSYRFIHRRLLNYLNALCYYPGRIDSVERSYILYEKQQAQSLQAVFRQPAYEAYIPRISGAVASIIYEGLLREAVSGLDSFEWLQQLSEKLPNRKPVSLYCLQAEAAIVQGDFEQAQQLSAPYDEPTACFAQAICACIKNDMDNALALFEKGLKKQRRTNKNTHIPALSEAALFFFSAWIAKEQGDYLPVVKKIVEEKANLPSNTYPYFKRMCEYYLEDTEKAGKTVEYLQQLHGHTGELVLWGAVILGLTGKRPLSEDNLRNIAAYAWKAFENGHYVVAYEAAYLLTQWRGAPEDSQLYEALSTRMGYEPALSRIKYLEDWEKQLNAYLSLEAVQTVIRQEAGNGKTRVGYRFFFDNLRAYPILQTRNANGLWTTGRNIAISTFVNGKAEGMTAQDRRIAAAESNYSYLLGRGAIREMAGHPHVFFESSDIRVELIAAQPILSVVKSGQSGYRIECDIVQPREGVVIRKESNTRYKIYDLNKFQCEIIRAIAKSKVVPEQGYEKLMKVLKHFSAHIQVQSDLMLDEEAGQLRQMETDSRIRVQLLPVGDELKAELFVKPFGAHPPYCKPGHGGKVLIANENGERLQVTRNLDEENVYNEQLYTDIQAIKSLQCADGGLISFGDPLDALELLDVLERHRDIAVVEWPEGERFRIRRAVTGGDLSLRLKSGVNWFEVEGELKVDENMVLTIRSLLELMRHSRGRFVELSDREFLSLSDQLKRQLSELASFATETDKGIIINRFASVSMMDTLDGIENLKRDKVWSDFRERLQTAWQSEASVPSLLQAELRPYQVAGFRWMARLAEWGAGACLADDMGLGKTVQTIALLLHRRQEGPALVVAPVSVLPNWINEINRFAPSLVVKTLSEGDRAETLASLAAGDLLVTTYGLLLSEEDSLTAKPWATVILDEAHAIKNYNTKISKAAMSLQANFRVALTGTPLQNHLGEMWNLFQFINPGLLGSFSYFTEAFIRPTDESVRTRLKKLISPFILRRTKTAVLEELPPKTEIVRKITLSNEETAFYEMLRRRAIESLESDQSAPGAKHLKALVEITRLRQACCNPALVEPEITIESSKLSTVVELASELKENNHRALLFSQFVTHLHIVHQALEKAGYICRYLDGSMSAAKRAAEVRSFQDGDGDFFLISLKAGGLGLNLTAADYVIHLDPWWNPAIEDQASDRAHRMGQNRPVTVYRLVAAHTIEEKILQLHNTKRNLADSLLEGSDRSDKLSIRELMELIKENI